MTPLKAALFDRIKAAGDLGVSSEELLTDCYEQRGRRRVGASCIKVHIWELNNLLVASDWLIVSDHHHWYLQRRFEVAA